MDDKDLLSLFLLDLAIQHYAGTDPRDLKEYLEHLICMDPAEAWAYGEMTNEKAAEALFMSAREFYNRKKDGLNDLLNERIRQEIAIAMGEVLNAVDKQISEAELIGAVLDRVRSKRKGQVA